MLLLCTCLLLTWVSHIGCNCSIQECTITEFKDKRSYINGWTTLSVGLNVQNKKYGNETDIFIAFKKWNTYTKKIDIWIKYEKAKIFFMTGSSST